MTDRLVLLGTKGGPAIRPGGPMPTSSLLEIGDRRIVVDCGLGVARGLCEAGLALPDIDDVFITHLHSDHVLELGPLLHTAWTAGLNRPVRVFGPEGLRDTWNGFLLSMRHDIDLRIADEGRPDLRSLVSIHSCDKGTVLDEDGLRVSALHVPHPPVEPAFALRFDWGDRSVVFSGDTAFYPPLAEFARGADVLVHEAMLSEGIDALVRKTGNGSRLREHLDRSHTSAKDAGRIASEAEVGRLVLHHLIPADDPDFTLADWEHAVRRRWDGPLTIPVDGTEIELG